MATSAEQPRPSRRNVKREKEVHGLGLVVLKPPTLGNLADAEKAFADQPEIDRASILTNYLLSEILDQPKMTPSEVGHLRGESLISLLELAADVMGIREEFEASPLDVPPRDRFYLSYLDYHRKLTKPFADAVRGFIQNLDLKPLQETASQILKLNIPRTILPSTLAISGLNSPQIHTLTYQIPEKIEFDEEDVNRRLNLDAYDTLLKLESTLREFISSSLFDLHGKKWWKQCVSQDIREKCQVRKTEREQDPFASTHHPLDYADLGDCKAIIIRNDNWEGIFSKVFGTKHETETCFMWAGRARVDLAHSRLVSDETYQWFTTGATWIQKRIQTFQRRRCQ